ncbi:MAG: RNA polymerase sigma factor [Acidobacteria bacterium]|nr:RNA polymerase sigma factor [Acidobacteriota bacterium]
MALSLSQTPAAEVAGRPTTMDEAAFRHLYRRTARPLRGYLMRGCGNLALADDLLQETYLRMLRSGFEGENDEHRKNYLYRIATNLLRDHFRRAKPETDDIPERDDSRGHAEEIHLRSDVGGAMAQLAPRDRQMLWLAYVEGASHQEIASTLGLRAASIRSMLFRARQRLATQLQARGLRPDLEGS